MAVRLQEADVVEWLDTESTFTVADRLCRSLGIDHFLCLVGAAQRSGFFLWIDAEGEALLSACAEPREGGHG